MKIHHTVSTSSELPLASRFLIFLILILLGGNSLAFLTQASMPYVRSDDWYFLWRIIVPWYEGTFSIQDVYTLRGSSDRLQPFHRLFLLLNVEFFSLDYRIRAVVGFIFSLSCFVILMRHFHRIKLFGENTSTFYVLVFLVLASCWFTMNAVTHLTWPLVMFGFLFLLLASILFIYVSNILLTGVVNPASFALLCLVVMILSDDIGMLAVITALLFILFGAVIFHTYKAGICNSATILATLLGYVIFKSAVVIYMKEPIVGQQLEFLFQTIRSPILAIDFLIRASGNSLAFFFQLREVNVQNPVIVQRALGTLMLLLQISATVSYFKFGLHKRTLVPIMMLVFYWLLLAGVLLYRLPQLGIESAANSPRYIRTYIVGLFATAVIVLATWPLLFSK